MRLPPRKTPTHPHILLILSTLLLTPAAHAEFIIPGDHEELSPTLLQGQPEFDGALIAQQTVPFNLAYKDQSRFSGDLLNEVVRSPVDNTLSFYYSVLNPVDDQQLDIWVIDPNNFKGLQTDLSVLSVNPNKNWPISVSRGLDGSTVYFPFIPTSELTPGDQTQICVVKTNATHFDNIGTTLIDATSIETQNGKQSVINAISIVPSFRPIPPTPQSIPLPPAWTALPTLLAATLLSRTRRRIQT